MNVTMPIDKALGHHKGTADIELEITANDVAKVLLYRACQELAFDAVEGLTIGPEFYGGFRWLK